VRIPENGPGDVTARRERRDQALTIELARLGLPVVLRH
jgi:hypothetical protein